MTRFGMNRVGLIFAMCAPLALGCGDDTTSSGGAAQGGNAQGGSAQGGAAQGGNAQGGNAQGGAGGAAQGGSAQGGNAQGGGAPNDCTVCPNALCDADLGCVQCLSGADCQNPAQPVCFFGTCEECGTNMDCGVAEYCELGGGPYDVDCDCLSPSMLPSL